MFFLGGIKLLFVYEVRFSVVMRVGLTDSMIFTVIAVDIFFFEN